MFSDSFVMVPLFETLRQSCQVCRQFPRTSPRKHGWSFVEPACIQVPPVWGLSSVLISVWMWLLLWWVPLNVFSVSQLIPASPAWKQSPGSWEMGRKPPPCRTVLCRGENPVELSQFNVESNAQEANQQLTVFLSQTLQALPRSWKPAVTCFPSNISNPVRDSHAPGGGRAAYMNN